MIPPTTQNPHAQPSAAPPPASTCASTPSSAGSPPPHLTTLQIAKLTNGQLIGPGDISLSGVAAIAAATEQQLTFISQKKFVAQWKTTNAKAALVSKAFWPFEPPHTHESAPNPASAPAGDQAGETGENTRAIILVDNAELAMAHLLEHFEPASHHNPPGVHPACVVHHTARLGKNVAIDAFTVVGPNAIIGDNTILHSHVHIGANARLGAGCELFSGAVVRERCTLGDRVILHNNAVIGADGFGYLPDPASYTLQKITHIGTVNIGDDVEIGANTCIDRGKFAATCVGDGTKIDNLVQIGHNCIIGKHCAIAGQTGLAGSVTLGDHVQLGGKVGIKDHATVGRGARISGLGFVIGDVPPGQTWAGSPAKLAKTAFREYAALKRLPAIVKHLKRQLEL